MSLFLPDLTLSLRPCKILIIIDFKQLKWKRHLLNKQAEGLDGVFYLYWSGLDGHELTHLESGREQCLRKSLQKWTSSLKWLRLVPYLTGFFTSSDMRGIFSSEGRLKNSEAASIAPSIREGQTPWLITYQNRGSSVIYLYFDFIEREKGQSLQQPMIGQINGNHIYSALQNSAGFLERANGFDLPIKPKPHLVIQDWSDHLNFLGWVCVEISKPVVFKPRNHLVIQG